MSKQEHVDYWILEADENWKTAISMLETKHNVFALFAMHLVIEKLLKAIWVKHNSSNFPPRTHNVVTLLSQSNLKLNQRFIDEFEIINSWNLEGRYPDYQRQIYKIATSDYCDQKQKFIDELRLCLLKELQ